MRMTPGSADISLHAKRATCTHSDNKRSQYYTYNIIIRAQYVGVSFKRFSAKTGAVFIITLYLPLPTFYSL